MEVEDRRGFDYRVGLPYIRAIFYAPELNAEMLERIEVVNLAKSKLQSPQQIESNAETFIAYFRPIVEALEELDAKHQMEEESQLVEQFYAEDLSNELDEENLQFEDEIEERVEIGRDKINRDDFHAARLRYEILSQEEFGPEIDERLCQLFFSDSLFRREVELAIAQQRSALLDTYADRTNGYLAAAAALSLFSTQAAEKGQVAEAATAR
ncbi:MAG: hypothetical protein C4321_04785, partial [Chloroflexota bacterium]